mmetsp:Transcript_7928/g.20433  ORF Transcript_7928/g.20433 Transcript_7928/m.20433 type:complete len:218 (-) Transcript_7928:158-811(-)
MALASARFLMNCELVTCKLPPSPVHTAPPSCAEFSVKMQLVMVSAVLTCTKMAPPCSAVFLVKVQSVNFATPACSTTTAPPPTTGASFSSKVQPVHSNVLESACTAPPNWPSATFLINLVVKPNTCEAVRTATAAPCAALLLVNVHPLRLSVEPVCTRMAPPSLSCLAPVKMRPVSVTVDLSLTLIVRPLDVSCRVAPGPTSETPVTPENSSSSSSV